MFIYLLCQANESNPSGQTMLSTVNVSRRCTVSEKEVNRTIKILKQFQVIEIRTPSGRFVDSEETVPTNERTRRDERNERDERTILPDCPNGQPRLVFDFDSLYKRYPRKEGKQRGMKICAVQIKNQEDFDNLSRAIDRYAEHIKLQGTEGKYIKHFSTFMGEWRDWLEADTGKVEQKKKETNWAYVFGEEENA